MSSEVTLKDIADALEISAMTVSRALNNRANVDKRTRQRVLKMAKKMGYTPNHVAKSLVSSKTFTIGVVIPEITHAFFPEVVRGIEEITNSSNYQLFLTNSNEQFEREKAAITALQSKRADGILISSSQKIDDYSFYKNLIKSQTKVVFFDRCIEHIGASCVSVNDRESSRQITDHLLEVHDHTRIAHLSGPRAISIGKKRFEGYKDALQDHGLPIEEKWIIECGFREEAGYKGMKKLLSLPKNEQPTAIVAVNDPVAFGAIKAIEEAGYTIPDDFAIVGFTDDIRAPLLKVPLTTVRQSTYDVGKRAAKKLLQVINDPDEPIENIEVLTELKIRNSCGC